MEVSEKNAAQVLETLKTTAEAKPGKDTTEYQRAKSAGVWGNIGMVLGALIAFLPKVLEVLGSATGEDSLAYLICGLVLAIASKFYSFATDAGYIQSRTRVKERAEEVKIASLMNDAAKSQQGIDE